jgi:NitT/TauT family transport system ATP-binding protein
MNRLALDAITRDEMNFELLRIWQEKQKTIVFITHGINEAVLMADSVLVMTQRPARIAKIIPIDLERPRTVETRASKAFGEYVVDIYKMMGLAR